MKRLDLAGAARNDLREIAGYTERTWGSAQKQHYMAEIRAVFAHLRNGTGIGRQRDDIRPGYLSANVGRHVMFYRETEEAIVILRILHARMDLHRRVMEE